jgi:hypothetical protein
VSALEVGVTTKRFPSSQAAGNVLETHEHKGDFEEMEKFAGKYVL